MIQTHLISSETLKNKQAPLCPANLSLDERRLMDGSYLIHKRG